jgi:ABC-2 type transport system permease protein
MTRARLFTHVLSIQARKVMSYRADFWTNAVVTFFVEMAIAWFLWTAIFRETGRATIGGFTEDGMIVYYLAAILLGKLARGSEQDINVATDIYEGALTKYLLYPSSYFGFKYAEFLGTALPALVEFALFGAAALLLLDVPPDVHVTPASALMAAGAVAVANLLYFVLIFPMQEVAFWADNVWTLNVMFRFASQMLGGFLLPLSLFPDWSQPGLAVLPFRFLYYFPAMTLIGRVSFAEWAAGMALALGWCAAVGGVSYVVWRRGTRQYTGVGI